MPELVNPRQDSSETFSEWVSCQIIAFFMYKYASIYFWSSQKSFPVSFANMNAKLTFEISEFMSIQ